MNDIYDLFIIGGGINGTGIAADAAQRGLSVFLCEKNDLASATSSASSKLIHGGLRYLEQYEFKLVRKALQEREKLLHIAPDLIQPLEFILPAANKLRAPWLVKMGLFIYDHLAKTSLPKTRSLSRKNQANYFSPLKKSINHAYSYFDAKTDDARLVIELALQAQKFGASINTRTKFIKTKRHKTHWDITVQQADGQLTTVKSKVLINASGPWVNEINKQLNIDCPYQITPIKGSHIVVPTLYKGEHAYILQNDDNRIIFAIPYLDQFTLIGTTDKHYQGNFDKPTPDSDEVDYLCQLINRYFESEISSDDIVDSWSGIRPLLAEKNESAKNITRDYKFHLETNAAPLLSVLGGKITTYRKLADELLKKIAFFFPGLKKSQTASTKLPCSAGEGTTKTLEDLIQAYPYLPEKLCKHYFQTYGQRSYKLMLNIKNNDNLGQQFSELLYQYEVDYLCQNEWATTAEDILYRRTKHGLVMNESEKNSLKLYLQIE